MALVCALSGTTPEEPVLSSTGYIFEKRLITEQLKREPTCPLSGTPLSEDDLQPIKKSKIVTPRPLTASSIPGMLSLFQNEWDSLMLECFTLKNNLETMRSQLSQCLYQHDAAARVIARMLREKEEAQATIKTLQQQLQSGGQLQRSAPHESDNGSQATNSQTNTELGDDILDPIVQYSKVLLAGRKKRTLENVSKAETVRTFKIAGSHSVHSSTSLGILTIEIDPKKPKRVVTGGIDSVVAVFDFGTKKTIAKLHGHSRAITKVCVHPEENVIISASDDKTIRIWKSAEGRNLQYSCANTLRHHSGPVNSISLHPLNKYIVSSSADKSWMFHDIESGQCLRANENLTSEYRSVSFHPDGVIVGAGTHSGEVHIWDLRAAACKASLPGHEEKINCLAFSENGYYMASAGQEGTVRLWDLRKSLSFQTIKPAEEAPIESVCFDNSGQYIAACAHTLDIYFFESRAEASKIVSLDTGTRTPWDAKFGPNASYIVSTSSDRVVDIWEPSEISENPRPKRGK